MAESTLTGDDIEDILDEIQETEEKQHDTSATNSDDAVTWEDILHHLRERNTHFIKNLITSKEIHVNAKNPSDGKTLLIYAVIIGNLDLVQAICNFGSDIKIKDNDKLDALDYAMIYGRYKITEMVYYRQLSGKLGNDLKQISIQIHQKNKEAQYMYESCQNRRAHEAYIKRTKCSECGMRAGILCAICKKNSGVEKPKMYDNMIHFMIGAIKERAPFDPSMLFYAWYFVLKKCELSTSDPFRHELWETMMSVYEQIVSNTKDKNGWKWLKEQFIPSLIWYLPHPKNKDNASSNRNTRRKRIDDKAKMENTLHATLFYELLHRVRKETKKQSVLLLKEEIDGIKSQKAKQWKRLIAYNVSVKQSKKDIKRSKGARQDSYGCLKPKYNKYDLSETKYPSSTHFSAKKHYDTKIYLNELIFRGNILDNLFQNDMKNITKQINKETGDKVTYRAGPVKTLTRSQTKVENDYIHEQYPTSAKILDINRCALQFKTIAQMIKYMKILSDKIKNEDAGCIKKIIRCKNGWTVYNLQSPQYTDIKLNVLIKSEYDGSIIAEIQFLLDMMSQFKKKAHKLYSIERKSEFVYNYGLLTEKISEFKDLSTITAIFNDLAINDDHKRFKYLWENNKPSIELLVNMADNPRANILENLVLNILIHRKGDIHRYLRNNFQNIYRSALMAYFFNFKIESFDFMLGKLVHHGANQKKVTQRIIDLFNTDKDKKLDKKSDAKKILQSLNMFLHPLYGNLSRFLIEHKAFNYYQLQAPSINVDHDYFSIMEQTEFKFEDDSNQSGSLLYWHSTSKKTKNALKDIQVSKMASYDAGHSLILDTNGNVYALGDADPRTESAHDLISLMSTSDITNKPVLIPSSSFHSHKVMSIAVGGAHSMVLTEDGNVWSWGFGKNGRLGHNSTDTVSSPKVINALLDVDVISIACGALHNCAISRNGDLFCWGNNTWGQCALKTKGYKEVRVPTKIKINVDEESDRLLAVFAACSNTYTLLLTTKGTLLSFGSSVYGCLGHGEDDKQLEYPKIVQDLSSECVVDIAAGERRCLCVTKQGALYQWGEAFHTIKYNDWTPKRVLMDVFDNKKIVSCRVNTEQSSLITADGELYELKPKKVHHPQFMGCDIAIHPRKINDAFEQLKEKIIVDAFLDKEYNFVIAHDRNEEDKKTEDESHGKDICLRVNEHVVIRNDVGSDLKGKSFKMYVKNKSIYGHSKWNLLASNKQYLAFPNYTDVFANNLQLLENKKIVLENYENIDEIYHLEILQSKYALIKNQNALEMKQESISKDQIYTFSRMNDIQFDIEPADSPKNELNLSIYVLPSINCDTFVLLKQFK